jgi:wyosine [tRNA(Phe)-imidazoG37] synthetase (radical SAM superfamily)
MNPDKRCNFHCAYCEVDRAEEGGPAHVPAAQVVQELREILTLVRDGKLRELGYANMPSELLELREIALSGDGEPTLCPNFRDVVAAVANLRSRGVFPYFKIVLLTNCAGLHLPEVCAGIAVLSSDDEVWAKLDTGTQAYMDLVNRSDVPLKAILRNIRDFARKRPVVIQSLFPSIDGNAPPDEEIEAYARCLRDLRVAGAEVSLVQIYSAHRLPVDSRCGHLPLRVLSKIARRVREVAGLEAEVF